MNLPLRNDRVYKSNPVSRIIIPLPNLRAHNPAPAGSSFNTHLVTEFYCDAKNIKLDLLGQLSRRCSVEARASGGRAVGAAAQVRDSAGHHRHGMAAATLDQNLPTTQTESLIFIRLPHSRWNIPAALITSNKTFSWTLRWFFFKT